MSGIVLAVRDLRKVFVTKGPGGLTEHTAVNGVTFEVPAGSCLAIVGESGSGKTTTARIIAGLERPDSGEVIVQARRSGAVSRAGRRPVGAVQMVFQDPFGSLDPRQRVGSAIDEVLRQHSRSSGRERRERVLELLDQVGLDERHSRELPRHLSGGQRQRVAIARALAMEPEILILDEAVSALDVSVQAQVLNLLIDIRKQTEVAYVFVSHDLGVVRQISDEVVVMSNGRVVEQGLTAEVLDHPREEYTKQLIDAIPRPGWVPRRRSAAAEPTR
ncbi:ABC transporter ATP-binding protein [Dactylosporangium sp. NPDC048998]|uniref:ABC transporter ATP-binding protein n=1 Tax=Dactylosporangium sp. NPDC048998 TaxID=3363976 RepID=UPI00371BE3B7